MIYNILFAICGIGLIAFGVSLIRLSNRVESWQIEVLRHTRLLNDIDHKRFEDSCQLAKAFERIQDLEDQLETHAEELTEHHNKIDTLEINGSIYESLFEQQGLWGEIKE